MQAVFSADVVLPQTPRPLALLPVKPSTLLASTAISLRPRTPSLRTTKLRIRASSSSSGPPPPPPPAQKAQPWLLSLLKPACVTLATAAALLAAGLHVWAPRAAFALAQPPPAAAAAAAATAEHESKTEAPLTEEEKESLLEEYLHVHPDDIRSLHALMGVRTKAGRYAEAIEIVDRLALLEPDVREHPLLKAHLQNHAGDREAAKKGFEALIQEDPCLVEAYHGLVMIAVIEATGDTMEARELERIVRRVQAAAEKCRKENRKDAERDFRLLVGQIRVMQGRYVEAITAYQELMREDPMDFRPYLCQGIVYSMLGREDDAEKLFKKYRGLVPSGHPFASCFEDNVMAIKGFGRIDANKRAAASASLSR